MTNFWKKCLSQYPRAWGDVFVGIVLLLNRPKPKDIQFTWQKTDENQQLGTFEKTATREMLSLLLEKRLKWLFLKRLSDSFRLIFWQSANCSGSSHMLSPSVSSQMVLISVLLDTQGVLLYGPPGTGKTLLARAVAHHTDCTFIRVSGSELVQKFIGEGELLCLNTVISHFHSLLTFQKLFKSTRLYNLNSSLS